MLENRGGNMNPDVATVVSRMQNLEIALWILIGILFVGMMLIILFVVPALIQAKKTLNEAETAMKTVNTDILPKVNNIIDETGPVLKSTMETIANAVQTVQNVVSGVAAISKYIPVILTPVFRNIFSTMFKIGRSFFSKKDKGGNK
jgi:phage-related protein